MQSLDLYKKSYKIINIITITSTLLLLFAFAFSFDTNSGYLLPGPLTTLFFVSYIIGVIVSFSPVFFANEFEHLDTPNTIAYKSKMYYTVSAVSSTLFGILVFSLTHNVENVDTFIASGIGLVFFGLFITSTLLFGYDFNIVKIIFLFGSMAFPLSIGLGNNKNYYHHINSIENILTVLFCISFLIYILYEAKRICTGRHSELHFPAMLLTYMSGMSLSLAYVFAFLFQNVNEGYRFYQMIMIFSISIHMIFESNRFMASATPKSKYSKIQIEENQNTDN